MRLASYTRRFSAPASALVLASNEAGECLADVAFWSCVASAGLRAARSTIRLPGLGTLDDVLRDGPSAWTAVEKANEAVTRMVQSHGADSLVEDGLLLRVSDVELLPPVVRPSKLLCAGRNYQSHDGGAPAIADRGSFPPMFLKAPSGLAAHGATISAAHEDGLLVPEVELAAIIGRRCAVTGPEEALAVVAGYTIMNDLTDASHFRGDSIDLVLAKNFLGCAPLGPWMVTPDEIGDPQDLELACAVNGEPRQADSTASMIWQTAELIAYSSGAGLAPGDVVSTGSPAGVFSAGVSVRALSEGDTVEARIAGIGCLTNVVGRAGVRTD